VKFPVVTFFNNVTSDTLEITVLTAYNLSGNMDLESTSKVHVTAEMTTSQTIMPGMIVKPETGCPKTAGILILSTIIG
jgi:hypothetical protein